MYLKDFGYDVLQARNTTDMNFSIKMFRQLSCCMFDVYFFISKFKTKLNLTPFADYNPKLGGQKQSIGPVVLGRSSSNTCIAIDTIDSWIGTPSSSVLTLSGCRSL